VNESAEAVQREGVARKDTRSRRGCQNPEGEDMGSENAYRTGIDRVLGIRKDPSTS